MLHCQFAQQSRILKSREPSLTAGQKNRSKKMKSLTWIKSVQPLSVEFSVDMTASLYVRTPMNSKPTREATRVNTPKPCSSQCLLEDIGRQEESHEAALL